MGKDQFGSSDKSRKIPAAKIKKAKKKPGIIAAVIKKVTGQQ